MSTSSLAALSSSTFDPLRWPCPPWPGTGELDLVFIDGSHGYPLPVIDWFYGAGLFRRGGVVVLDDVQLPQVESLIENLHPT
jgi:hypothetical protein